MKDIKIIKTDDGSHSLYLPELNETYHSFHGAINEAQHVFIDKGLSIKLEDKPDTEIHLLEIGFGTGLNALMTIKHLLEDSVKQKIHYHSIEAYPLAAEIYTQLNYPEQLNAPKLKDYFDEIHECGWDQDIEILPNFILHKYHNKIEDIDFGNQKFDLVYFDAFAPSKQAEMWTLDILGKIKNQLNPKAVFVSYCAKGQFKRDLKALGFTVETLDGPPGKKEMVRGVLE